MHAYMTISNRNEKQKVIPQSKQQSQALKTMARDDKVGKIASLPSAVNLNSRIDIQQINMIYFMTTVIPSIKCSPMKSCPSIFISKI